MNIVSPSSFTRDSKFPVKVYIHGGYASLSSFHEFTAIKNKLYIPSGSSSSVLPMGLALRRNMLPKNVQKSGSTSDTVFRCSVSSHATSPRSRGTLDSRINGSHCSGFRRTLKDLEVIELASVVGYRAHRSVV